MDRNVGELLMSNLLAFDEPLNSSATLVNQIPNKEEQKEFRRGIGEIVGRIYTDLMLPIIRQYPDLDPEKRK